MENVFLEVDVTIYFQKLVSKSSPQRGETNLFSKARRIFSVQTDFNHTVIICCDCINPSMPRKKMV